MNNADNCSNRIEIIKILFKSLRIKEIIQNFEVQMNYPSLYGENTLPRGLCGTNGLSKYMRFK